MVRFHRAVPIGNWPRRFTLCTLFDGRLGFLHVTTAMQQISTNVRRLGSATGVAGDIGQEADRSLELASPDVIPRLLECGVYQRTICGRLGKDHRSESRENHSRCYKM